MRVSGVDKRGKDLAFFLRSVCFAKSFQMLGEEEWVGLAVRSMEKERKKESRSN
jgi:hypothetical protein